MRKTILGAVLLAGLAPLAQATAGDRLFLIFDAKSGALKRSSSAASAKDGEVAVEPAYKLRIQRLFLEGQAAKGEASGVTFIEGEVCWEAETSDGTVLSCPDWAQPKESK